MADRRRWLRETALPRARLVLDVLDAFRKRVFANEIPVRAASLSFTTLLSMVPLLAVVFGLLANFRALEGARLHAEDFLMQNLLPGSVAALRGILHGVMANAGKLSLLGTLGLFLSSASLFLDLHHTVNRIWRVRNPRPFLQTLVFFWLAVSLGPLLLGLSFLMSGEMARQLPKWGLPRLAPNAFGGLLSYAILTAVIFVVVAALPAAKVSKSRALVVSLLGAFGSGLLQKFFTFSFGQFANIHALYGSLAFIPLFFSWVYFNWVWILVCVQITEFLVRPGEYLLRARQTEVPRLPLVLLAHLARRSASGSGPARLSDVARDLSVSLGTLHAAIGPLETKGWVFADDERVALSVDPAVLEINEVEKWLAPEEMRPVADVLESWGRKKTLADLARGGTLRRSR